MRTVRRSRPAPQKETTWMVSAKEKGQSPSTQLSGGCKKQAHVPQVGGLRSNYKGRITAMGKGKKSKGAKSLSKYAASRFMKRSRRLPTAARRSGVVLGWLSFKSPQSILSAFSHGSLLSFGSILSIGSTGSVLSIGSVGSILSIGSAGSILSIGSAGSILSIGSAGGLLNPQPLSPEPPESELNPQPLPPETAPPEPPAPEE